MISRYKSVCFVDLIVQNLIPQFLSAQDAVMFTHQLSIESKLTAFPHVVLNEKYFICSSLIDELRIAIGPKIQELEDFFSSSGVGLVTDGPESAQNFSLSFFSKLCKQYLSKFPSKCHSSVCRILYPEMLERLKKANESVMISDTSVLSHSKNRETIKLAQKRLAESWLIFEVFNSGVKDLRNRAGPSLQSKIESYFCESVGETLLDRALICEHFLVSEEIRFDDVPNSLIQEDRISLLKSSRPAFVSLFKKLSKCFSNLVFELVI